MKMLISKQDGTERRFNAIPLAKFGPPLRVDNAAPCAFATRPARLPGGRGF